MNKKEAIAYAQMKAAKELEKAKIGSDSSE